MISGDDHRELFLPYRFIYFETNALLHDQNAVDELRVGMFSPVEKQLIDVFYLYFLGRAKRLFHRIERTGIEMVNMICDARADTGIVSMRDELEARRREERKK